MTLRHLSKDQALASLAPHRAEARVAALAAAVRADPRESFTVGNASAETLRRTLSTKYRIARENGKLVTGDADLLQALGTLGSAQVMGFSTESGSIVFVVFYLVADLSYVGVVTVAERSFARRAWSIWSRVRRLTGR